MLAYLTTQVISWLDPAAVAHDAGANGGDGSGSTTSRTFIFSSSDLEPLATKVYNMMTYSSGNICAENEEHACRRIASDVLVPLFTYKTYLIFHAPWCPGFRRLLHCPTRFSDPPLNILAIFHLVKSSLRFICCRFSWMRALLPHCHICPRQARNR